jgi:PAS domain S-box-containing protein
MFAYDPRFAELIFDRIPHGIFTVDERGRISSFNRAAEEMTGWSREDVRGLPCAEIFQADHCESTCFLRQSIEGGQPHRDRDVRILRRDGAEIRVAVSTAALEDDAGRIVGGVEMFRDLSEVDTLRRELQASYTCADIVSKSAAMRGVRDLLPLVARSSSTVLIEGEPGTGKELVARAIHNHGPRRDRPFVAINCGAIPDTLVESELFGYVRGAFTDARTDKPGRFALAEGGTLLLDEVGDLSPATQVKLLRVLQEREYTPLGAVQSVQADVRILAATHRDLATELVAKRFRQDLYFRLNIVRLVLPPLRARPEDIPLLVRHFIAKFNALQGRRLSEISERAMNCLLDYPFPGNVRELENAIEHAFVVSAGTIIELKDLPPHMRGQRVASLAEVRDTPRPRDNPLRDAEAATLREVLTRHGGNRAGTARELGISRNTLWRKMKQNGIGESWPPPPRTPPAA